jgi:hypothetical protein
MNSKKAWNSLPLTASPTRPTDAHSAYGHYTRFGVFVPVLVLPLPVTWHTLWNRRSRGVGPWLARTTPTPHQQQYPLASFDILACQVIRSLLDGGEPGAPVDECAPWADKDQTNV